jgi:hypothetical protein
MKDKNINEMTFFETTDILALKWWFSMRGPPGLARVSTRLSLFSYYTLEKKLFWLFLIFYINTSSGIVV